MQTESTRPQLSPIIWGTMLWGSWGRALDTQSILRLLEGGVELGITTYDLADIYGDYTTEADFGKSLKLAPSLRSQIQLISKCGIKLITPQRPHHKIKSYDSSAEHIRASVEHTLRVLNTDYLDLLLIHRPDPLMHPEEVAETFHKLKNQGKVLHFGVSNFTPSQFSMLSQYVELVSNQVEASLLHLDPFLDGTFDQCLERRIQPMAWSPLGGGAFFTASEEENQRIKRIKNIASALRDQYDGASLSQILLAWLLRHPAGIQPVLGTSRLERAQSSVQALDIHLSREDWFKLWTASTGEEVP